MFPDFPGFSMRDTRPGDDRGLAGAPGKSIADAGVVIGMLKGGFKKMIKKAIN